MITGKAQTAKEARKLCKKLRKTGKYIFLWRKTPITPLLFGKTTVDRWSLGDIHMSKHATAGEMQKKSDQLWCHLVDVLELILPNFHNGPQWKNFLLSRNWKNKKHRILDIHQKDIYAEFGCSKSKNKKFNTKDSVETWPKLKVTQEELLKYWVFSIITIMSICQSKSLESKFGKEYNETIMNHNFQASSRKNHSRVILI